MILIHCEMTCTLKTDGKIDFGSCCNFGTSVNIGVLLKVVLQVFILEGWVRNFWEISFSKA